MLDHPGSFAWYELLTTDMAAARTFYGNVMGWRAKDASTPDLAYSLFIATKLPLSGLMELPEAARQSGATPRWIGYIGVDDVDAVASRIRQLGGAVYVPPTDTNIGRIAIVADPQTATFGLVTGLKSSQPAPGQLSERGRVGWHELLAADRQKAFVFYREIFGWRKADSETNGTDSYQLFSAGGEVSGGIFNKRPVEPIPFWLYYFNVADIDAAATRVKAGGGRVFEGPFELPDGGWIVRCLDPQGAMFALQGMRSDYNIAPTPAAEFGFSAAWEGFSSRGRLRVTKPNG
jgi:hypothetical protein